MDVELESAEPVLDIDLEHRAHWAGSRESLEAATHRLSRAGLPSLAIKKTYNLAARAGIGALDRDNGVGWPGVIGSIGWFREVATMKVRIEYCVP
jgi:hypothetical protein